MSKLFHRKRRTRDINGLIPVLSVLFVVGLVTGFSEIDHSLADASAVAEPTATVSIVRVNRITPASFETVTSSVAAPKHCDRPTRERISSLDRQA